MTIGAIYQNSWMCASSEKLSDILYKLYSGVEFSFNLETTNHNNFTIS